MPFSELYYNRDHRVCNSDLISSHPRIAGNALFHFHSHARATPRLNLRALSYGAVKNDVSTNVRFPSAILTATPNWYVESGTNIAAGIARRVAGGKI